MTDPSHDNDAKFAELRAPFPDSAVGKLPRVTCRDCSNAPSRNCQAHKKVKCEECHNFISERHIHLDYVGHAAVTDRLLAVDPHWTWEPMALDDHGLPLVSNGSLWIKLTVLDVTRLGVGEVDRQGTDGLKSGIGDAIRNAAMRFGVALDLWSKEDLVGSHEPRNDEPVVNKVSDQPTGGTGAVAPKDDLADLAWIMEKADQLTDDQRSSLAALREALGVRSLKNASAENLSTIRDHMEAMLSSGPQATADESGEQQSLV